MDLLIFKLRSAGAEQITDRVRQLAGQLGIALQRDAEWSIDIADAPPFVLTIYVDANPVGTAQLRFAQLDIEGYEKGVTTEAVDSRLRRALVDLKD